MVSSETFANRRRKMSRRILRGFDPQLLATAREATGLSRADLARVAGVGISTIRQWETGLKSPQVDKLALVANAVGVPISALVAVPVEQRFPGDWRVLAGLTQPQLGVLAGLTTSMIGQIERGEGALTESSARKIAQALGISVAELRAAHERAHLREPGTPA